MYDIITIGAATRDVFMTSKAMHSHKATDVLTHIEACFPFGAKVTIDEILFTTGGGATNAAATFSKLGKFKTAALCRIGDDSAGKDVLEDLRVNNINTQFVQVSSDKQEHTGFSAVLSPGDNTGERTILVYRGASKKIEHEHIHWEQMETGWFYCTSFDGDFVLMKDVLDHAKKIKAKVMFNPGNKDIENFENAKSLFKQVEFLSVNREEASKLTGEKIEDTKALLKGLKKITANVIMTDGQKGAYAATKEIAFYAPSVGHPAKNRTGAGDAFGSGFLTGWINSKGDLMEALRVGSFNADSVVQGVGAKNGILQEYPSSKQLHKLTLKEIIL